MRQQLAKRLKQFANKLSNKEDTRSSPPSSNTRRLTNNEWKTVLTYPDLKSALIRRVREGALSDWGQVVLEATFPGESILEIGSGTGEISLRLAVKRRRVTLLDFNAELLAFAKQCALELGVSVTTVQADALKALPFPDDSFDCTWSSGLLEHFTPNERRSMLSEQGRITKRAVITLVPNAACLAYRAGKLYQEQQNLWPYGIETPILSLRGDYEAAGLQVKSEYSVGFDHALNFLPVDDPLRRALSSWMKDRSKEFLRDCHQGYLLVTEGVKPGGVG